MRWMSAGLVLLPLLAACQDRAAAQAAEAAKLLDADRAFAAASLGGGTAEAYYARADGESLQLPANAPPVRGSRPIRERFGALGLEVLDWTPRQAQVARSLDLGWTWGEWRLLESEASRRPLAQGKYLRVWRRGADGGWKLAADIGNQAEEPPAGG
jgi:ketosteroid isomerase-like protein